MSDRHIDQDLARPISRLRPAAAPRGSDQFAVFRGQGDARESFRVSYEDLALNLVQDISAGFHLSSMAFRDMSEYARFDHTHAYQHVVCSPGVPPEDAGTVILRVETSGEAGPAAVDVRMPKIETPDPPRPDVGDVRLLATDGVAAPFGDFQIDRVHADDDPPWTEAVTMRDVDTSLLQSIADGTFDGWVYPDGSEYFKYMGEYDFSEAYAAFGGSDGSFRVPLLSGFMQMNPGLRLDDPIGREPGRTGIAAHSHELDSSGELDESERTVSAVMQVRVGKYGNDTSNKNRLHAAGKNTKNGSGTATNLSVDDISVQMSFDSSAGRTFGYDPVSGDYTCPKHAVVPALIYIGGARMSQGRGDPISGVDVTYVDGSRVHYDGIARLTRESIGIAPERDLSVAAVAAGSGVLQLEDYVFKDCVSLSSVDLYDCPLSVEVPEGCCEGCSSLVRFLFPSR